MRKHNIEIVVVLTVILVVALIATACNYNIVDTKWTFNYAYITFPDGHIEEVEVKSWAEDQTSVTITAKDDNIYCVSMHNCLLTKDRWEGFGE